MNFWMTVKKSAIVLAALGMLVPSWARAEVTDAGHRRQARTTVLDVALGQGGRFVGQVVNGAGAPVKQRRVALRQGAVEVATANTDEGGYFEVRGLRGGVYQVVTDEGGAVYRLWAPNTAPPAAKSAALLVTGGVTRGQAAGLAAFLANPWVLAGIATTAVVAPLALDEDDPPASN